jgi:hypothetical protein
LETSLEKTFSQLNQIITDSLKIIVKSKQLNDFINGIIRYYRSKLNINLAGESSDMIKGKEIQVIKFIKFTFSIIRNLKSEYFTLISEYIDYRKIVLLIKNIDVDPESRMVLVKTYTRYFLINHFRILLPMKRKEFDLLADISESANMIGEYSDDFEEIKLIIENIENYPQILFKFRYLFDINNDFYMSYFFDVIVFPVSNCIYKLLYFSKSVTSSMKYIIYKLTYLFLESYLFFISNFESFNVNFESRHLLEKYFVYETLSWEDLNEMLYKNINQLKSKDFNLNINKVLQIFQESVRDFTYFKLILNEEGNTLVSVNSTYDNLNSFIEKYTNAKQEDANNMICSTFQNTEDPHIQQIKEIISLNLFFMMDFKNNDEEGEFYIVNEKNLDLISPISKLFKIDPKFWQKLLKECGDSIITAMNSIIRNQLPFLVQVIFINFNKLEAIDKTSYQHFILLVEFLRLFAETHNKIYQTFLINYYINKEDDFKLNYFMLKIPAYVLNHISYFKAKKQFICFLKNPETTYFDDMIKFTTDYLIEVIQGSYTFNLDEFVKSGVDDINKSYNVDDNAFDYYCERNYKYFDYIENEEEYEKILAYFMRLINALIEEHSNSLTNKNLIIKKMNPKKMLSAALYCMKKLYKKYKDPDNKIEQSKFTFEANSHKELLDYYLIHESFSQELMFILASSIFIYLKTVESYSSGEKSKKLLESLSSLSQSSNVNDKNKSSIYYKTESFLFFEQILKSVEVSYKIVETLEGTEIVKYRDLFYPIKKMFKKIKKMISDNAQTNSLLRIVFVANPSSMFLLPNDIISFLNDAPFENFDEKLSYMIEGIPMFQDILGLRRILNMKKNPLLNYLYTVDYHQIKLISVYFAFLINLISIFTVKFVGNDIYDPYKKLVFIISSLHNLFNFFFIVNWLSFEVFKQLVFLNERETDMTITEKIYNLLSLLGHPNIFYLVFSFVFGLLASLRDSFQFMFSLLLFPIFDFFPTMQSVIISIQIRYQKFSYTALLIVILILLYSSISFLYFQDSYFSSDLNENICQSYLQCFLSMFNYGIRSGGIGDFSGYKSFSDTKNYWGNFIFNWIFYFTIVLIMINIVNGIIVDTFQDLREQSSLKLDSLTNVCYICSLNRSKFEINGLNYTKHIKGEHNLLNYFHYLIKVKSADENDLNSLDYQVLNYMKEEKFDFFPIKKSLSLDNLAKK